MAGLISGLALLGLFWLLKTIFSRHPESAPGPLHAIIEHDVAADAKCVRMVEHGLSHLLVTDPGREDRYYIERMREALKENGIDNPTAWGLLTARTVQRLRMSPVRDIDPKEVDFLFDDGGPYDY